MTQAETLPVALVTGANRGIGIEVVRQLAHRNMTVILGSRDLEKGKTVRPWWEKVSQFYPASWMSLTQRASIA